MPNELLGDYSVYKDRLAWQLVKTEVIRMQVLETKKCAQDHVTCRFFQEINNFIQQMS